MSIKVNTTAKTPFDVAVGELADLRRLGLEPPEDAERISLGPAEFERYLHRDVTGYTVLYWRRIR